MRSGKGILDRGTYLNKGSEGGPTPEDQLSCHPVFSDHEWVFHALDQGKVRPRCSFPPPRAPDCLSPDLEEGGRKFTVPPLGEPRRPGEGPHPRSPEPAAPS